MTKDQLGKLTFKRLAKGQMEKIKRHRNWKTNIELALDYIYESIDIKLGKKIILNADILCNSKGLTNNKMNNDARLANNRSCVMFLESKNLHVIMIDLKKKHMSVTISQNYNLNKEKNNTIGIEVKDLYKPFKCYQIDEKCLNIDPRIWTGISFIKKPLSFNFNDQEKLY